MEFQLLRKHIITKTRGSSFFPVWVRQRELRQRLPIGHSDAFYKSLYSSISQCHSWGGRDIPGDEHALSSLEFSPDGTLLVAGCEDNSFLLFDPLSRRLIRAVDNAHSRCITDVKFLDSRIFATGSADHTVSLWDTRNLRSSLHNLFGYSHKFGNLEFSRKSNLLITSGIAGTIYIRDIHNWKRIMLFNTYMPHDLHKLRLNPDETKMIISSTNGYLLIVHELDLNKFAHDMSEFLGEMIDSASLLQANTTAGWSSDRFVLPKRRRNRVEIVADFPNADGCVQVISALEIHPQGRSVISRSECDGSDIQYTCVHDIQQKQPSERGGASRGESGDERPPFRLGVKRQRLNGINEEQSSSRGDVGSSEQPGHDSGPQLPDAASPPERGARKSRSNPRVAQFNRRVHAHVPRLTHYIEEPHAARYFSKLCVSADGRLVCSLVERGIRLLAFSPECSEQSVSCCGTRQRPLYEVSTHCFHSDTVLSVRFSPRHCLLVSGSLDGKLIWFQPVV